jgi:hypothetical protein
VSADRELARDDLKIAGQRVDQDRAIELDRQESTRLYWEHRLHGHPAGPVDDCPICDEIEEAAESGHLLREDPI